MAFRINNIGDLKNIGNEKMRKQALDEYKVMAAAELKKVDSQASLFENDLSGQEIKVTLPYPPTVNTMYHTNPKTGIKYMSKRGREFKKQVADILSKLDLPLLKGRLEISMWFFRPRKIGDWDNVIKIAQDSLKGVCFVDDEQITDADIHRRDDAKNPRAEITLKQI